MIRIQSKRCLTTIMTLTQHSFHHSVKEIYLTLHCLDFGCRCNTKMIGKFLIYIITGRLLFSNHVTNNIQHIKYNLQHSLR